MNPIEDMGERLVRVEVKVDNIEADVIEIRGDIRDIKGAAIVASAGLTRPEKIALAASGSAVVGAIIGVIALLSNSSGP